MDKDAVVLLVIILLYYSILFLWEQHNNRENLESCWQACNIIPTSTTTLTLIPYHKTNTTNEETHLL